MYTGAIKEKVFTLPEPFLLKLGIILLIFCGLPFRYIKSMESECCLPLKQTPLSEDHNAKIRLLQQCILIELGEQFFSGAYLGICHAGLDEVPLLDCIVFALGSRY